MKEYNVHFSHYSEQYGNFNDTTVKVDAANQFEARSKAWEALEKNEDRKFMSCIKLCGITWEASPLDMQDYFNAATAKDKYKINYIENIDKPNAKIDMNSKKEENCERDRYSHFGSLNTISDIAKDFGKTHGLIPPAIYEELHYAREFVNLIDKTENDLEKSWALMQRIKEAEKWDNGAMFCIKELFKSGYGMADGHEFDFSKQFDKNGIYQMYADKSDSEYKYIHRWVYAKTYITLTDLPFFGEKDVIANSKNMDYDWQTLVLKKESLPPEKQIPENALWTVNKAIEGKYRLVDDNFITV